MLLSLSHPDIEQPTMAATLSRLERDGLIEPMPNPADGRSALISLTPAAMDKARHVTAAAQAVDAAAPRRLQASDREAFLAALATVISSLEEMLEDETDVDDLNRSN